MKWNLNSNGMKIKIVLLCLLILSCIKTYSQQKPNIVFMLADDCTSWDIGVYGNKDSKTPTIDHLASQGMLFTKCYQATPMCSPTRQNILTGLYPIRSGAYPNHTNVNSNVKSIAQYLKPLGYRVALGGKQHYGPPENFPIEYLGKTKGNNLDPDFARIDTFLNTVSTKKEPFCLFICSNQPHTPWNMGDTTLFDESKLTLPPIYPDLPKTRSGFRRYLAEINYLDGQVKQALDLLDKYKLDENTIFVFASEQGNSYPFAKWTCYNAGLKSALIVRWSGKVKANTVSNALVEYSDITPTFIDIAGGKPVEGLDGSSIVPVLTQKTNFHKKYSYAQMTTRGIYSGSDYFPIRSISNGTYRYIVNLTPGAEFRNTVIAGDGFFKEWKVAGQTDKKIASLVNKYEYRPAEELYDDETDPFNQHNLIGNSKFDGIKNELKQQLKKWMVQTGDKGILTELMSLEHMPTRASGYPVIIDTLMHKPKSVKGLKQINIPVDGYYTFYIDGKGSISVDQKELVSANSKANDVDERYGVIGLKKGMHSMLLNNVKAETIRWSGPETKLTGLNGKPYRKKKQETEDN